MVLKALLQQAGLNERVAGGLGSYCLLNLVMAHLMSQVSLPASTSTPALLCSRPLRLPCTCWVVLVCDARESDIVSVSGHAAAECAEASESVGACAVKGVDAQSQYNLGHLLLAFLDCFGNTFDYRVKAVSVRAVSVSASHTPCCFYCKAAGRIILTNV